MILSNQVECLKCGDKPFSRHRHDMVYCKCGAVAVDGGMVYLKRLFKDKDDWVEMSIEVDQETFANMMDAMDRKETNNLGKVCEIARVLRDANYLRLDREACPPGGYLADNGQTFSGAQAGASEGLCP